MYYDIKVGESKQIILFIIFSVLVIVSLTYLIEAGTSCVD
jgi:hypothetical protein